MNGKHSTHMAIAARRKRERTAVAEALEGLDRPVWPEYYVTLERIAAFRMDGDNLQAGFKAFRDEVADFLELDDADTRITWRYRQRQQRVRDPSINSKLKWKVYARIVIAPTSKLAAAENPEFEPRHIDTTSKPSRPRPKAVPEPRGGKVEHEIELPVRYRSSRVGLALRWVPETVKNDQAGTQYIRAAIYWERSNGDPWRSQGVTIRLHEVEAFCAALRELAARAEKPT